MITYSHTIYSTHTCSHTHTHTCSLSHIYSYMLTHTSSHTPLNNHFSNADQEGSQHLSTPGQPHSPQSRLSGVPLTQSTLTWLSTPLVWLFGQCLLFPSWHRPPRHTTPLPDALGDPLTLAMQLISLQSWGSWRVTPASGRKEAPSSRHAYPRMAVAICPVTGSFCQFPSPWGESQILCLSQDRK